MRSAFVALACVGMTTAIALGGCSDDVVTPPAGDGGSGGGSSASSMGVGGDNVLEDAQLGDPNLVSAQRIAFGPGGVLLIGDGRSNRLIAIETGDTSIASRDDNTFETVGNLTTQAANVIGDNVTASEITITDVAVNPISWRAYVAVTRHTTGEAFVLTRGKDGQLYLFDLSNVVHAIVDVPPADGTASTVVDLAWTSDFVIGSLTPQSPMRHELTFVPTPFQHESGVRYSTTSIYHRSFGQWFSDRQLDHFFTYERDGEQFIAGSFTSSIVRFEVADLEEGRDDVVGTTVFDITEGRTIADLVQHQKGDDHYVVVSVNNFLFDGNEATVRIHGDVFAQSDAVNDMAPFLFDFAGNPLVTGVERLYPLDGAIRLDKRGEDHVVLLRPNDLRTRELP